MKPKYILFYIQKEEAGMYFDIFGIWVSTNNINC